MTTITTADRQASADLGRADRETFDVQYDAWLAQSDAQNIPDYTEHYREQEALLGAILGGERTDSLTTQMTSALRADDLDAYDAIEYDLDALYRDYADAWGDLPK